MNGNSGTETDGTNLQAALNLRLNLLEDLEFQTTASYAVATIKLNRGNGKYALYNQNSRLRGGRDSSEFGGTECQCPAIWRIIAIGVCPDEKLFF